MIQYVTGFMTNAAGRVCLIRKNRPAWQVGKINGIGGKVEPGEWPHQAMVREFYEETGLSTEESDWHLKIQLVGPDFELNVFTASREFSHARSVTDERILSVDAANIPYEECVQNLRWMFPLVHDKALMFPVLLKDRRVNGSKR